MNRLLRCLAVYALTSTPIFVAGVVAPDFIAPVEYRLAAPSDLPYTVWDGKWYAKIAGHGYDYDPIQQSSVAFFPLFPLVGAGLSRAAGLHADVALFLIANLAFLAALVVIDLYVHLREPNPPPRMALFVLLSVALFPTSFFFRFPYSESLFLLLVVAVLLGMNRDWPLWIVAALIGLAAAARPVGIGLLLPFASHVWMRSRSIREFAIRFLPLVPLASWGLLAYMAFLNITFGDPFAFAQTQNHWRERPAVPFIDKLIDLLALEPVWSVFVPSCACYWEELSDVGLPFSLQFANPILFVFAALAVYFGNLKGWLNRYEVLIVLPLLAIPYATRGHEMCMNGFGRFASVVFPMSLVIGRVLHQLPLWISISLLAASGGFCIVYAALCTAGSPHF